MDLVRTGVEFQAGDSAVTVERYSVGDQLVLSKLRDVVDGDIYRQALH